MTYFHYYATTSRNLDRVLQYAVYPIAQTAGMLLFRHLPKSAVSKISGELINPRARASSDFARAVSSVFYSSLTTWFLGSESEIIDRDSRKAVAAEMGVDPDKLKFSDYKYSNNAIVKKSYSDLMKLQPWRYGTDILFILPTALRLTCEHGFGHPWPESELMSKLDREDGPDLKTKDNALDLFLNWHNAWNYSVLAGKAAYWAGETFLIEKSGNYEVVKLIENLESAGKDMNVNDLLGVYQRSRSGDRKLPMIEKQEEYDALRPLLKRVVDAYNKHDGKIGIPEIVYLIGLNKISIHAADQKTLSQEAVEQSNKAIDQVLTIGLDGIREEKKKLHAMHGITDIAALHQKSFVDRVSDGVIGAAQSFMHVVSGSRPRRQQEYITPRDPGEVTHYSLNR